MKAIDGPRLIKLFIVLIILGISLYYEYKIYYKCIYDSIDIELKDNTVIEYGKGKVDVRKFIKNVEGKIISKKTELDTSIVGKQKLILKVKKANVEKKIPVVISIVDSTAPVISLKSDVVKINVDDNYNLNDNVLSVVDEIDGNIDFSDNISRELKKNYNIFSSDDIKNVGSHNIVVNATDSYGNSSSVNYTLVVEETAFQRATRIHYNLPANSQSDLLVSVAYSLLGKAYVSGGNGPDVFDCSGLVKYVYSSVGINISRSSSSQLYDGRAVSTTDMMPGDIICWGNSGRVTHTAIYVGNDQMIHAANYSQGVILSSVSGWDRGSYDNIISVRRI